jgi:hypothetical protein
MITPDRLAKTMEEAAQALRNAERNDTPSSLFFDIAHNPQVSVHGPREQAAEMATIILGKKMSPMRAALPALWIRGGLWLVEIPDVAAFLETQMKDQPALAFWPPRPMKHCVAGFQNLGCSGIKARAACDLISMVARFQTTFSRKKLALYREGRLHANYFSFVSISIKRC